MACSDEENRTGRLWLTSRETRATTAAPFHHFDICEPDWHQHVTSLLSDCAPGTGEQLITFSQCDRFGDLHLKVPVKFHNIGCSYSKAGTILMTSRRT